MKKSLLVVIFMFLLGGAYAQDPVFLEGDQRVNLGVGISSYPNVFAALDYGLIDGIAEKGAIGVGPYAAIGFGNNYSHLSLGARGTFHYPIVEDLDTYVGFAMGVRYAMSSYFSNIFHPQPGFFLGASYPIDRNFVVFGELGSGVSYLTAGVTIILE